jgi:hypothetical protein
MAISFLLLALFQTWIADQGHTLTQQTIQLPPRADGGWIKRLFTRGENACYTQS